MDAQSDRGLVRFFKTMPDPRAGNALHSLTDIFVLAICAVICGCDGWVQVAQYANTKRAFFTSFLELANGIPSHDTFGRVFAQLNPVEFEKCFCAWVGSLAETSGGKLLAIDGKSLRRSFERSWDKSGMAHLVSAFASNNQMVFGQLATEEGSNEITAIPKLLELLELENTTVTIDAIGCQKEIAKKIRDGKGNYFLAAKDNQHKLYTQVKSVLDEAIKLKFAGMTHDYFEETSGGHGRIETRQTWITTDIAWLGELIKEWPGLSTLTVMKSSRKVNGQTSITHRYYIGSNAASTAQEAAHAIRSHWAIENNLHWILDMSFDEDQRRVRNDDGAENFSRLCRIALNLLKTDKTKKVGIKTKRLIAGWDDKFLLGLLLG